MFTFCIQALVLLPEFLVTGKNQFFFTPFTLKRGDGNKNPPLFISVARTLERYTRKKQYTLNIYFAFAEQES